MKITKVRVSYSELVSTGNFENKKVGCELEAEISREEAYEPARKNLYEMCVEYVKEKIAGEDVVIVSKTVYDKYCEILNIANGVSDLPF